MIDKKRTNLISSIVTNRNWHYTFNRRARRFGWDVRRWPRHSTLSDFVPELESLVGRIGDEEKDDFAAFLVGISRILVANGKFHSQLGQEAFVIANCSNVEKPYFLEIGAFHPYQYSNTATFRDHFGWDGLSVDPSLESAKFFYEHNLSDKFLNVGVAANSQEGYFVEKGAFSETVFEDVANSRKIELVGILDLVKALPEITYLSLDIEGGELEILLNFPWDLAKPLVITVEHNHHLDVKKEILHLLESKGYRRVLDSVSDFESWFILENSKMNFVQ